MNRQHDDILKHKLETFEDSTPPSEAQISRLLADSPKPSANPYANYTKWAALGLLLLTFSANIYYFIRVKTLEDSLSIYENRLIKSQETSAYVSYDSSHIRREMQRIIDIEISEGIEKVRQAYEQKSIAEQRFTSQQQQPYISQQNNGEAMVAQLQRYLETNPDQSKELLSTLLESPASEDVIQALVVKKENPSEDKALKEKGDDDLINRIAQADNQLEGISSAQLDSLLNEMILAYIAQKEDEELEVIVKPQRDSLAIRSDSVAALHDIVRKSPAKTPKYYNFQWGLGGYGASLEGGSNAPMISASANAEVLFGSNLSILSGFDVNFMRFEEKDFSDITDLVDQGYLSESTVASNPALTTGNIKEVKVSLLMLDLPLETRYYFIPEARLNPFIGAAVIPRYMLTNDVKIEKIEEGEEIYIPIETNENPNLILSSARFTAGTKFKLGRKTYGTLSFQYYLGLDEIGDTNQKIDATGFKFNVIHPLK